MGKLDGRIALVTGGTTGIGFATAKLFRDEGARVIVTGRNAERVAHAREELGRGVEALIADTARKEDINSLFVRLARDHGRLDVLFLNAGIAGFAPLQDFSEELFDEIMDVNYKGAFFTLQRALPLLSRGSSVILNASIAAHVGMAEPPPTQAARRRCSRSPRSHRRSWRSAASGSTRSRRVRSKRQSSESWACRRRR